MTGCARRWRRKACFREGLDHCRHPRGSQRTRVRSSGDPAASSLENQRRWMTGHPSVESPRLRGNDGREQNGSDLPWRASTAEDSGAHDRHLQRIPVARAPGAAKSELVWRRPSLQRRPCAFRQQDTRAITRFQSFEPGGSGMPLSRECRARAAVPLIVVCMRASVTARAGARIRCRDARCTCRCAGQAPRWALAARLANNSPPKCSAPPQRLRATYPQTCHRFIHTRCG